MKFEAKKPDYVVRVEGKKITFKHGLYETNDKSIIKSLSDNKNITIAKDVKSK